MTIQMINQIIKKGDYTKIEKPANEHKHTKKSAKHHAAKL